MPAIQVRELPQETYIRLKKCAADNHRSIAQQTTTLIEEGLARRGYVASEATVKKDASAAGAVPTLDDIPIPRNVRETSARARFVDPFGWAKCLEIEPDEVIAERKERRRKLREMISEIEWSGPAPTLDEIVAMIREDRDRRTDAIIVNVGMYLEKGKDGKL